MIDCLVTISDILIDSRIIDNRVDTRTSNIPHDGDLGDEVDRDTSEWICYSDSSRESSARESRPEWYPTESTTPSPSLEIAGIRVVVGTRADTDLTTAEYDPSSILTPGRAGDRAELGCIVPDIRRTVELSSRADYPVRECDPSDIAHPKRP